MEAENMTEAFNLANTRVKKEYSGLRRSGLKSVRLIKDTDEEYENDIVEATRTNSETLSDTSNKDTNIKQQLFELLTEKASSFDEALPQMIDNHRLFKVTITPGRKPRKRDINKDFIIVPARSIEDAEDKMIQDFSNKGVTLKRKWISVIPTSLEELTKSGQLLNTINNSTILDKLNSVINNEDDTSLEDMIEPRFNNDDLISSLDERLIGNLNDATTAASILDENGFIIEINPKFIALSNVKPIEFVITAVPNFGPNYPPIETRAKSVGNAIAYVLTAMKHERLKNKYPDINYFNVLNKDTGKIIQVDFKCIREVSKNGK